MDIYVLAGQSNMAGRGVLSDDEEHPPLPSALVDVWDEERGAWEPAREPLHRDSRTQSWVRKGRQGAGLGASFAAVMAAAAEEEAGGDAAGSRRVGLVCVAMGSSYLSSWEPGGENYARMAAQTGAAAAAAGADAAVRALLWHHGEADAMDAALAASYSDRLTEAVRQLRADLSSPQMVLLCGGLGGFIYRRADAAAAELGGWNGRCGACAAVDAALRDATARCRPSALVSADGLRDGGDLLHFDAPSLRRLGERYAAALLSVWDGRQPTAERGEMAERRRGEDGGLRTRAQFALHPGGTDAWDAAGVADGAWSAAEVELRVDRTCGVAYSRGEYIAEYGDDDGAKRWAAAGEPPPPPPLR